MVQCEKWYGREDGGALTYSVSFEYDSASRVTKISNSLFDWSIYYSYFDYCDLDKPKDVWDDFGNKVCYNYDRAMMLKEAVYAYSDSTYQTEGFYTDWHEFAAVKYGYDNAGRLISVTNAKRHDHPCKVPWENLPCTYGGDSDAITYEYGYDNTDNRNSCETTVWDDGNTTSASRVESYEYDLNSQLIGVNYGDAGTGSFNYDDRGNHRDDGASPAINRIEPGATTSWSLDDSDGLNRLTTGSRTEGGQPDPCSFVYDDLGNMTMQDMSDPLQYRTYAWDAMIGSRRLS